MAAPQSYAPTGDATVPEHNVTDAGGTLSIGTINSGMGGTERNYIANINTSANMAFEVQNLVSIFTRATATGYALPPRAVMLRLKMVLEDMLRETKP